MLRALTEIEREQARMVSRTFQDAGHGSAAVAISMALGEDSRLKGERDLDHLPEGDGRIGGRCAE